MKLFLTILLSAAVLVNIPCFPSSARARRISGWKMIRTARAR